MMSRKFKQQGGFTLIEVMIAMTIFVLFLGIMIGSYTSIVRGQREANVYRVMYSESRRVFETLVGEFRDGMIDYGAYASQNTLNGVLHDDIHIISKDGTERTDINFDEAWGLLTMEKTVAGVQSKVGPLIELNSSDVKIRDFTVYVYPFVDPYSNENVHNDVYQFHPKVTIKAVFEKERLSGEPFILELQTSVSSRIYNQVVLQK